MEDNVTISDAELQALVAQAYDQQVPVPAPVPPEAEARRNHRWLVFNIRGNLYWRGQDYGVKVCDVSCSGLGLETAPSSLQAGTQGIIVLDLDEYGTLAVTVEIMHTHECSYTQRLGVQFTPSHPDELRPLMTYIEDLSEHASKAAKL